MKPSTKRWVLLRCTAAIAVGLLGFVASACSRDQPATVAVVATERLARVDQPVDLAFHPASPTVLLAQRTGVIIDFTGDQPGEPVLDLSSELAMTGEGGLLSISYDPDGRYLYVSYVNRDNNTRVAALPVDATGWPINDNFITVVAIDQPFTNHNGGFVRFGPDGHLYVGLGDGGSANDPTDQAQNLDSLLGKILRITPTPEAATPYTVPADNPFLSRDGTTSEIWAYGLRNPWRFSFDRTTGDLYIGDVGQDAIEEIDRIPGDQPGANFGWNRFEGPVNQGPEPADHVPPVHYYSHDSGRCAVVGGYVYRGSALPELNGAYLYGDYCDGKIRAIRLDAATVIDDQDLGIAVDRLSAFVEAPDGELYVLGLDGAVERIVANEQPT